MGGRYFEINETEDKHEYGGEHEYGEEQTRTHHKCVQQ